MGNSSRKISDISLIHKFIIFLNGKLHYFYKITTYNKKMGRDICQRCDDVPEDILVLECEHKICLGCASVLLHWKNSDI